ncbi:leucyl/phenylalanyl-tRNA--protein transferase [Sphingosinicella sp. LHD-64]|uniref:leucyl/phenylalanyl-tRNA--protein transferase n=1 Tax=Sphingosinicella sp. LHD-64 TaxID=3072139 RepID=UPI00280CD633|nr:leucyl/phenylalanyl-tRNA--protein transferase [Sphingosinicella sp. LHD-64]MDQ8755303.1 leucyl/phenylalanyl-tRNA--protein transferase [Sphingosinicella sp. LHD-64]
MALDPDLLLRAYSIGAFPMSDSRDAGDVFWVQPRRRAILPLEGFHASKSLRKRLRAGQFEVTRDRAFPEVVAACADREDTWINVEIEESYALLHRLGHAHSVEVWDGRELIGGLYGVVLGRAFFGESMFSRRTDASKVALAWLVARLRIGGFTLLDCQFMTEHLRSLGAVEITQERYLQLLSSALGEGEGATVLAGGGGGGSPSGVGSAAGAAEFEALDRLLVARSASTGVPPGWVIAQLIGQTS